MGNCTSHHMWWIVQSYYYIIVFRAFDLGTVFMEVACYFFFGPLCPLNLHVFWGGSIGRGGFGASAESPKLKRVKSL